MDPLGSRIELAFTELLVVDWPRAVRWYVEILGLRLILEDVEPQFALLEAGLSRLALKGSAGGRQDGSPPSVRLIFRVDDVDAERDRLIGLGVAVGPASDNSAEGYRGATLVDSEGTPITLFSWHARPGS